MAIYHQNLKHISRGKGQSSCAAAAYRSASKIYDQRLGKTHNYEKKQGVDYTEILAPSYAPSWVSDRAQLWNRVEQKDTRINARPASELDIALPIELSQQQQIKLIKTFAQTTLVARGLIVDLACHDLDSDNPHAHLMFTTRKINEQGLGEKEREIKSKSFLSYLRQTWEEKANEALSEIKIAERIDHRTLEAQGINRVPQVHRGPHVDQMETRGIETDRGDEWRDINTTNERIDTLLATKKGEKQEVEKLEKQITEEEESEGYLHERHPIEENQTKNEANPLTKFTNFLSKFSQNRDDFENLDQVIIHSPTPLEDQFPIYTANPLAESITNLSADGNNIKTKQALKLANKYHPILNDFEAQLDNTDHADNKEIKLQSVNNEQWRIGSNQDHTEFWIVRENETGTEVKIHLQSEKDKLSLEYNLEGGDFHQLYSKLIEKLKSKPAVLPDNKAKKSQKLEQEQPEPTPPPQPITSELEPEITSEPEPKITSELKPERMKQYIMELAVSDAKKEATTFSEFKQILEDELITVEEEKKENNEIKLYYTYDGDRETTVEDNEIGATLPELIEKGICYAPKSQLEQSNLIEEERPGEEQQQQQNENERIEENKSEEEQQQRERIDAENHRIQEEEQRKQQQRENKRKQNKRQQKRNQDWEL